MKQFALLVALSCATAHSQDQPPNPEPNTPPPPTTTPTPRDAVGWALADAATLPPGDRIFQRYLWIPPWADADWIYATSFTINSVSRASRLIPPRVLANGWLLAWDLRRLAPNDTEEFTQVWDDLALQDPYFHVRAIDVDAEKAVLAPHLIQGQAVALADLTLSTGGIYRADWFVHKALTQVDGGAYYDLVGVRPSKAIEFKDGEGSNEQEQYLVSRGFFLAQSRDIAGDRRSAILRSGVTERMRTVVVIGGLKGTYAFVTQDTADRSLGVDDNPFLSLLDPDFDATEIIIQRDNGLLEYTLFDGKGALQEVVPDTIASDHSLAGSGAGNLQLQPGISCIRCHGMGKFGPGGESPEGFQPFGNDVLKLLRSGKFQITGDVSVAGKKLSAQQVQDRLERLFAAELDLPDGLVGRARRDYASAVRRLTEQKMDIEQLSALTASIQESYTYDQVSPLVACRELGIKADDETAVAEFNRVVPDFPPGSAENVFVIFLKTGVPINRREWEQIYPDVSVRAYGAKSK